MFLVHPPKEAFFHMKIVHRLLGILIAFCLMWILFITSIQAVVYWNP